MQLNLVLLAIQYPSDMERPTIYLFLILCCFCCSVVVRGAGLKDEFTWSRIDYAWPQDSLLASRFWGDENGNFFFNGPTNADSYLSTTQRPTVSTPKSLVTKIPVDYQYVNNIPMGANVWKDKLFVTVPRRRSGIPSTLNYVPLNSPVKHNLPLIPYPNWNINLFPDTSGKGDNIVSVYRIAIDECDRMWLVDTGVIETLGNATKVKQPQLILINLLTDEIIHRVTVPESVLTPRTVFTSVTVDVSKRSCNDAFAYFPDLAGYGLIVFSLELNRFWRVKHNYFYLESTEGDFSIGGYNFQWTDGIFSVEVTEEKPDGFRDLFFHAMAGTHKFKVSTKILRNETLATRSYHGNDITIVGNKGKKFQTSMADMYKPSGILFLNLVNQNALGCWNTQKNLNTISIVHKDDAKMIYPSDVKVSGDRVYVLTNRMPIFIYGKLNYDDVNFRIWSNTVKDAIKDTNCEI
ncbi:hypothetical protein GWI33_005701 [Rhynchophorus ferrugineus]|uniref:Uncharacterized protein n=1 Tax=Rhynchophorus ferrugineus TaxID=354439 RepID=A0A834IVM2_RHYFE|nr:hypothetical protein GWI33_005701 [Rhynchophorus ferrugineus]